MLGDFLHEPNDCEEIATMVIFFRPEKGFKVVQAPKKKKSKKVRELVGRATPNTPTDTFPDLSLDGYFGVRKSMEKRVTREASYTCNLKSLNVVFWVMLLSPN